MHFTKTLDDVRDQVETDDREKRDYRVRCEDVTFEQGRLTAPLIETDVSEGGLSLTSVALSQVCRKLGLPASYMAKCPPKLLDANLNHWLEQSRIGHRLSAADSDPDAAWLVRSRGTKARGVLSDRYGRLDNRQVMDALLPLVNGGAYGVGLVQLTDESFHLRLVQPNIYRDVLPNDRLCVGIHVSNSEIGLRACTVDALVYRVICSNGLIRKVNSRSLLRQRHFFVSPERFAALLDEALREAVVVAAGFLEQMALGVRTPVPDPIHAVTVLGEAWNLTQTVREQVLFALHGEAAPDTAYGLVNAFTEVAQRLPGEGRFELEASAAVLIDTASGSPTDAALRRRALGMAA
ncbi:MAG: DUF932 domain-containing protein [Armatimonadota bacterium]